MWHFKLFLLCLNLHNGVFKMVKHVLNNHLGELSNSMILKPKKTNLQYANLFLEKLSTEVNWKSNLFVFVHITVICRIQYYTYNLNGPFNIAMYHYSKIKSILFAYLIIIVLSTYSSAFVIRLRKFDHDESLI